MECLHTVPFFCCKILLCSISHAQYRVEYCTWLSYIFNTLLSGTLHKSSFFFMRLTLLKFLFRGFLEVSSWLDLRITFHNHFNCFILFLSSLYAKDTWLLCGCKYSIWFQNMSSCLVIYGFPFYSLQKNKLFWSMKCNILILYKLYFEGQYLRNQWVLRIFFLFFIFGNDLEETNSVKITIVQNYITSIYFTSYNFNHLLYLFLFL